MMKINRILGLALSGVLAIESLAACGTAKDNDIISVVTREEGSGTRGAFVTLTGVEAKYANGSRMDNTTVDAISVNSTAIVMTTVAGNRKAIGYISLGSLNDMVKAVQIDGAAPSPNNIKNGSYTLTRPFYVVTKGDLSKPAQDFMNFILSGTGQAVVAAKGYIEVDNTRAFIHSDVAGKVIVAGSSSVTPVMQKLQETYQKINSKVKIEIQESDSTTGINSTADETCDIGMISRELKEKEIQQGLTATVIAIDGIVVIVHKDNKINNLSMVQLKDIFAGNMTRWSEVK